MPVSCFEAPPTMPTMVSRLPKFGFQTKSATSSSGAHLAPASSADTTSTRLTNGFYHHPGPVGVNSAGAGPAPSAKQNGFLRVPVSFAVNCEQEHGSDEKTEVKRGATCQRRSPNNCQVHPVTSQQNVRATAGKGRVFNHSMTSSNPRSPQSVPKILPVHKGSSKLGQTALNLTNGSKQAPNGPPASKPWLGQGGSLRRPQSSAHPAGSGSWSPLQRKQASRSHSSDDLGSAPPTRLTQSDRGRSRSLNQVRGQASPTLSPSPTSSSPVATTRSHLYFSNRSGLKPASPQVSARGSSTASGQTPDGGGWGRPGLGAPSLLPPSSLKKPLLPSIGPSSKISSISYKLSRPSLNKQLRPVRVTPASASRGEQEVNKMRAETPPTAGNSQSGGPTAETLTQKEVLLETLDDMSLSSSASMDTNHTSQEYMDDFDNLGNGGLGILHLSCINDENDSGLSQSCIRFDQKVSVAKTTRLSFVDDGMECADMRLNGVPQEQHLSQLPPRRRSSGLEDHDQGGSSLDLSPSDSCGSGGIYMWDEEGLEHLGGLTATLDSNTTHHIGSFDSDLNSMDLLNHLDSCDLDDDDLMLDADDSDDSSLFSDGGGASHMAEWTRRQLCWGTQDFDNHSERSFKLSEEPGNKKPDVGSADEMLLDLCPRRSDLLSHGFGADVEELAEDCCAVRSQLEHLQRLLLQDDDVNEDTVSPEDSSHTPDSQVQALLQEVQQLREELRSRDQTIAHLTLQLAVPTATTKCHCQQAKGRVDCHTQTSVTEKESATWQTPRRENKYQRSRPYRGRPKPGIPPHLSEKRVEKLVFYFTDSACCRYFIPPAKQTRTQ